LSSDGSERKTVERLSRKLLHNAAECALHLPAAIGNYTDFFAGIHHAVNASRRLGIGLTPNYKYFPIAYHGRASSVRPSGTAIRRPKGQHVLEAGKPPSFGPCQMLDHEFESAPGSARQRPRGAGVYFARANHIFGFCMLNDWSARDIQAWEMAPLGPFLSKTSPRHFTLDRYTGSVAPFRAAQSPRPKDDPQPLPYLWNDGDNKQARSILNWKRRF